MRLGTGDHRRRAAAVFAVHRRFPPVARVRKQQPGDEPIYKITALWGGMEGSLLLWSWLLAATPWWWRIQNRRKFRNMMPYVTAIIATVQTFFLSLNAFVESPFKVWWAGRRIAGRDGDLRRPGPESAAPILDHGDPSAHSVSGLHRIHRAVRFRDGVADHQAAGRGVDPYHPSLDSGGVDVPNHGRAAGR